MYVLCYSHWQSLRHSAAPWVLVLCASEVTYPLLREQEWMGGGVQLEEITQQRGISCQSTYSKSEKH